MSLAWSAVAYQAARAIMGQWMSGARLPFPPTLQGARPILGFGSGMSALYVSGAIGVRTPDLVIGRLISMLAVGLYSRASSLAAQLVTLVAGAVGGVFYPAFRRIRDRGDHLAPPYLRVVAGYTAVTWPAMAFLAAGAQPVIAALYGPRWSGAAPLLAWVALSELFFIALPLHTEIPVLIGADQAAARVQPARHPGLARPAARRCAVEPRRRGDVAHRLRHRLVRHLCRLHAPDDRLRIGATCCPSMPRARRPRRQRSRRCCWSMPAGALPARVDFALLAASAAAGCLAWLATLFLVRHPARHEIAGMVQTMLGDRLKLAGAKAS